MPKGNIKFGENFLEEGSSFMTEWDDKDDKKYFITSGRSLEMEETFFALALSGLKRGIYTFLDLLKFLLPVYTIIFFLQEGGFLKEWATLFSPYMSIFGLPGEAAIPLILGNILNIYAALGALAGLHLSGAEITIISLMLLISHNQIMEGAVLFKVRPIFVLLVPFRLFLSILVAVTLNPLIHEIL
ncbi:MAG: nucleoside recognition protein [Deltaproteobacteria bacterium]|nr:MAG: nucleoside recognition protein [Deltaproteobacteria bacterium]